MSSVELQRPSHGHVDKTKVSASSQVIKMVKAIPPGEKFTVKTLQARLPQLSLGGINGFFFRAKGAGLIKLVGFEPGKGIRKGCAVYEVDNLNAKIGTKPHPFVRADGRMGGVPGRKIPNRQSIQMVGHQVIAAPQETTMRALVKVGLSDQLLNLAAQVAEMETKPDVTKFSTAELLAELNRRHGG